MTQNQPFYHPHLETRKGRLSLSFVQERLWFVDKLAPDSTGETLLLAVRLTGPLQVPALRQSVSAIAERHEILRTTVDAVEGQPVLKIISARPVNLPVIELAGIAAANRLPPAANQLPQPIDPSRDQLLQAVLYRWSPTDHLLLLNLHPLAADAASWDVLWRELAALYTAFAGEQPAPLPKLPMQYVDFAAAQRAWWDGPESQPQLAYWKNKLAQASTIVDIPTDHPRPTLQRYNGRVIRTVVAPSVADALKELCHQSGASQFEVLLAVFQTLLYRYTRQEDILIGIPFASRTDVRTESLIGGFTNTLIVRADVAGNPTFRELLNRVGATTREALDHSAMPFEKLIEHLYHERTLDRSPLAQVAFSCNHTPALAASLPGLTASLVELDTCLAPFDLALDVTESSAGLVVRAEYVADLFDAPTIQRLLGHYRALLAGAVVNPDTPVDELPLLTPAERERILVEWNQTARDYPLEQCLHQLVQAQVARTPDAVAVVFENQQLTYRQLNARANQLARRLQTLGVGPNVFAGICVERSLEMVIGLLAVLKAGGAYVPLDPDYPADRLAFMIADAAAPVLLTQQHLLPRLPASNARTLCLDTDIYAGPDGDTAGPARPDDLAYMIYTSGSTGKPKGAMNTHRGIINRLLWMQDEYRLTASDTVLQKTPFSFDVSVWEFFWPLLAGARLVLARPNGHREPAYLVELIRQQQVTVLHFVPSMLRLFLEEPEVGTCRSLRHVICSGEALPYELQQRFFERLPTPLHNLYGPTEAAVDVTYWACDRHSRLRTVPIGRPVANTQCYILDAHGQPVPVGAVGELHLGGVQVGRGYHNRPELTAEKFIADPFRPGQRLYKTGDLCRYLPEGAIEFLGRLDFQVKIRGLRVELGEIEAVLAAQPSVKQVVVDAHSDGSGAKQLVAYLVAGSAAVPEAGELRAVLSRTLPEYMVPAAFVWLPKLPLSPNGKVDRRALPAPEMGRTAAAPPMVAPRTDLERMVAELWRQVLGVGSVGLQDNFFDLGGDSLRLIQVHEKLRKLLNQELPLVTLFQYPTIQTLAGFLDKPVVPPSATRSIRQRAARQIAAAGTLGNRSPRTGWPMTHDGNLDVPLAEPQYESLARMVGRWVKQTPLAVAVTQSDRQWTYAALDASARALASAVRAGEVVAVSGAPSFGLVTALFGVLAGGGVLVTIDPQLPPQRQQLLAEQAAAGRFIWVGPLADAPEWLRLHHGAGLVVVDADSGSPDGLAAVRSDWREPQPDDAAYIFFTSGTTGLPKGVVGCHKGLSHFLTWQRDTFGVGPGDRAAQLTGLSFDVVLRSVFVALVSGGTLCLPPAGVNLGGATVLPWLHREAITLMHVVPSLVRMWLPEAPAGVSLPALRWAFFAGEPLQDSLVQRWRERFPSGRVVNLYGPTETTLAKFYYIVSAEPDRGVQPVGWPLPQTEGMLLENGEIAIRTPFRTRGYLNAPEEQARRFFPNPRRNDPSDLVYRTGDRGRFRADGALEILGRLDQQVKIQGVRIEPEEVSAVISRHPSVTACVVVPRLEPGREPILVGYVVAPGLAEPELRGFLAGQMPLPMVPSRFVFLERLPLTSNGKVDRAALPVPSIETPFVAPVSQTEQTLTTLWQEVLGVAHVGLEDNFFELGGNSLRLARVHDRLQAVLKYDVPITTLFQYPTIQALAGWLSRPAVPPTAGRNPRQQDAQPIAARRAGTAEEPLNS